jgi:hypothetical protein
MLDPNLTPPLTRIPDACQRLLRPAIGFNRPADVLKDPLLDDREKRAVLASWASNACALVDHPDLRWFIGSDGPVPLNEVLEAIARLDRSTHQIN